MVIGSKPGRPSCGDETDPRRIRDLHLHRPAQAARWCEFEAAAWPRVSYLARVSIEWLPRPDCQWTGVRYKEAPTDAPGSLHVARCTGIHGEGCDKETEPFGQINAPEIATLEVLVEGRWRRYPVAAPGYAVRLDGVHGAPTDDRWLDAAGQVVLTAREAPPGLVRP